LRFGAAIGLFLGNRRRGLRSDGGLADVSCPVMELWTADRVSHAGRSEIRGLLR